MVKNKLAESRPDKIPIHYQNSKIKQKPRDWHYWHGAGFGENTCMPGVEFVMIII